MSQPKIEVVEGSEEKKSKPESKKTETRKEVSTSSKVPALFPEIREASDIVREALLRWGCREDFANHIARYIERKGVFDPNWLFNMLKTAHTGRKWTDMEILMCVDEINSELLDERAKAESMGKLWQITLIPHQPRITPSYPFPPCSFQPQYQTQPGYQQPISTIHRPTHPQITQPPTQQMIQPQYPMGYQSYPTQPQDIQRVVEEATRRLLEEKRSKDEMEYLRNKITEMEKRSIEQRHETEKKIIEKTEEMKKEIYEVLSNLNESIKSLKVSIETMRTPLKPETTEAVTKKDLELERMKWEKSLTEERAKTAEKYYELQLNTLKEKIGSLESKIEEKSKPVIISGEGYSDDRYRLTASLGSKALDILAQRQPLEVIAKIIPGGEKPPKRKQVGKPEVLDIIKESGGEVE